MYFEVLNNFFSVFTFRARMIRELLYFLGDLIPLEQC